MTGVVQAIDKFGYRRFFDWCYAGYAYVQRLDQNYSDWLRVSKSIKTTSVEQRPARTRRAQIEDAIPNRVARRLQRRNAWSLHSRKKPQIP